MLMWVYDCLTEERKSSLTLNFPTILSSSVTFWSSSSPPFPLNRLKQCSQSSKLSNSPSSSFGYTLLDQRIHLKPHFFNVLLLTVVTVQHLQLLQLWLLLLCRLCRLLLLLLAFASFAAFHWRVISFDFWVQVCEGGAEVGVGEEEQRTPDMNPTWKLPKAAVTQYSKHLTEAYTTAIYISVAILGYLVGQGPLCQQLAGSFLHKSQSYQKTVLHVVYMESCVRLFFMCAYFTTELWRVFSVFFMDNFHGKHVDNMHRSGRVFLFPHMETWIHVSVYKDIIGGSQLQGGGRRNS